MMNDGPQCGTTAPVNSEPHEQLQEAIERLEYNGLKRLIELEARIKGEPISSEKPCNKEAASMPLAVTLHQAPGLIFKFNEEICRTVSNINEALFNG